MLSQATIVYIHSFSSYTTAGDHDDRNGDDVSDYDDGGEESLLGQGLGEQSDDSAPGSTGLGE